MGEYVSREEFDSLKKLVNSLIKRSDINKEYSDADTASERLNISNNTVGVTENDTAICDVADLSDVNSQAIDDLAEMVDELLNKVSELEG